MDLWLNRIHAAASITAAGIFTVIVGIMSADVISRIISGGGVPGTLEISEVILVVAVFASLGVAQWQGQHIAISLLTSRLPRRWRSLARRLSLLISAAFVGWIVWETGLLAVESIGNGEVRHGILSVPIWPARVMIVVGLVWWLVEIVRQMIGSSESDDVDPDSGSRARDAATQTGAAPATQS